MLEGVVADVLSGTLGQYFKIDKRQISLGIWSGVLEFQDLELRPETIDALWERLGRRLPVRVLAGVVSRVHIEIPWKTLGWSQPLRVSVEDVFVRVTPATVSDGQAGAASQSQQVKASQLASDASLREAQLRAWMIAVREGGIAREAIAAGFASAAQALITDVKTSGSNLSGWRRRLLRRVVQNIQFEVKNVWIRIAEVNIREDADHASAMRAPRGDIRDTSELPKRPSADAEPEALNVRGPVGEQHSLAGLEKAPMLPDKSEEHYNSTAQSLWSASRATADPAREPQTDTVSTHLGATGRPMESTGSDAFTSINGCTAPGTASGVAETRALPSSNAEAFAAAQTSNQSSTECIPPMETGASRENEKSSASTNERRIEPNSLSPSPLETLVAQHAGDEVNVDSTGSPGDRMEPARDSCSQHHDPRVSQREMPIQDSFSINLYFKQLQLDSIPIETELASSTDQTLVSVSKRVLLTCLTLFGEREINNQRCESWAGIRPSMDQLAQSFTVIRRALETLEDTDSSLIAVLAPLDVSIDLRLSGELAALFEGRLPSSLELHIQVPRMQWTVEHEFYQQLTQLVLRYHTEFRNGQQAASKGPRVRWWNALEALRPGFWARRRAATLTRIDSYRRRRQEREQYVIARLHFLLDRLLDAQDPLRAHQPIHTTDVKLLDELEQRLDMDSLLFYRHLADIRVVEFLTEALAKESATTTFTMEMEAISDPRELVKSASSSARVETTADDSLASADSAEELRTSTGTAVALSGQAEHAIPQEVQTSTSDSEKLQTRDAVAKSGTEIPINAPLASNNHLLSGGWTERLGKWIRSWIRGKQQPSSCLEAHRSSATSNIHRPDVLEQSHQTTDSNSATSSIHRPDVLEQNTTTSALRQTVSWARRDPAGAVPALLLSETGSVGASDTHRNLAGGALPSHLGSMNDQASSDRQQDQQSLQLTPFEVALLSELMGYDYPMVSMLHPLSLEVQSGTTMHSARDAGARGMPMSMARSAANRPSVLHPTALAGSSASRESGRPASSVASQATSAPHPKARFRIALQLDEFQVALRTTTRDRETLAFTAHGFQCTFLSCSVLELVLQHCILSFIERETRWTLLDWRPLAAAASTAETEELRQELDFVRRRPGVMVFRLWRGVAPPDVSPAAAADGTSSTPSPTEHLPEAISRLNHDVDGESVESWHDAVDAAALSWQEAPDRFSVDDVLHIQFLARAPQLHFYGQLPLLAWLRKWSIDWSTNAALQRAASRRLWRIRSRLQHTLPRYVPCCALSGRILEPSLSMFGQGPLLNECDTGEPQTAWPPLLSLHLEQFSIERRPDVQQRQGGADAETAVAKSEASATFPQEERATGPIVSWRWKISSLVVAHARGQALGNLTRLEGHLKRPVTDPFESSWLPLKDYWSQPDHVLEQMTSSCTGILDLRLELGTWQIQLTTAAFEALLETFAMLFQHRRYAEWDDRSVDDTSAARELQGQEARAALSRLPEETSPPSDGSLYGAALTPGGPMASFLPVLKLTSHLSRGQICLDIFGQQPVAVSAYQIQCDPVEGFALIQLDLGQVPWSFEAASPWGAWSRSPLGPNAQSWRHQAVWSLETTALRCLGPVRTGFLDLDTCSTRGLWQCPGHPSMSWHLESCFQIRVLHTNMNGEDAFRLADRFQQLQTRHFLNRERADHSPRRAPTATKTAMWQGAESVAQPAMDEASSVACPSEAETTSRPLANDVMTQLPSDSAPVSEASLHHAWRRAGTIRCRLQVTDQVVLYGSKQDARVVKASIVGRSQIEGLVQCQGEQTILRLVGCHEAMDLHYVGTPEHANSSLLVGRFRLPLANGCHSWEHRWQQQQQAWLASDPTDSEAHSSSDLGDVPSLSCPWTRTTPGVATEPALALERQFAQTADGNPPLAWRYAQLQTGRTFILHLGQLELVYLHGWMKRVIPEIDAFLQSFVPDGPPTRPVLLEIQCETPRVLFPRSRTEWMDLETTLSIESHGTVVYRRRAIHPAVDLSELPSLSDPDQAFSDGPEDLEEQWLIEAVTELPELSFHYGSARHQLGARSHWLAWIQEDEALDRTLFVLRNTDGFTTDLCEADYLGLWHTIGQNLNSDPDMDVDAVSWKASPETAAHARCLSSTEASENNLPREAFDLAGDGSEDPIQYQVDVQMPSWSSTLARGQDPQDENAQVAHFRLGQVRLTADWHRSGAYATFLTASQLRIEDARPSAQATRNLWPLVQDAAGLSEHSDLRIDRDTFGLAMPRHDASEEERSRTSRLLLRYHRQWSSSDTSQTTQIAMDLRYLEILPVAQAIRSIAYLASPFQLDASAWEDELDARNLRDAPTAADGQTWPLEHAAVASSQSTGKGTAKTRAVVTLSACRVLFPATLAALQAIEQDMLEGHGDVMLTCAWQTNPSQFHYELFLDHFRVSMTRYDPNWRWMASAGARRDSSLNASEPDQHPAGSSVDPIELVYPCAVRLMYIDTGDGRTPPQFDLSVSWLLIRLSQRDLVLVADIVDAYRRVPQETADWEHLLWHEDADQSRVSSKPGRIRASKTFSTSLRIRNTLHPLHDTQPSAWCDAPKPRGELALASSPRSHTGSDAVATADPLSQGDRTSAPGMSATETPSRKLALAWHRWQSGRTRSLPAISLEALEAALRPREVSATAMTPRGEYEHHRTAPRATMHQHQAVETRPAVECPLGQQQVSRPTEPASLSSAAIPSDTSIREETSAQPMDKNHDLDDRSVAVNVQLETVVLMLLHEDTRIQMLPTQETAVRWADVAYGHEDDPLPVISYLPTAVFYGACSLQGLATSAMDTQLALYVDIFNDSIGAWEPFVERCAAQLAWRNQLRMLASSESRSKANQADSVDVVKPLGATTEEEKTSQVLWHLAAVDTIELNVSEAFLPALDRLSSAFQSVVRDSRLFRASTLSADVTHEAQSAVATSLTEAYIAGSWESSIQKPGVVSTFQGQSSIQPPAWTTISQPTNDPGPGIRRHPRPTLAALVVYNHTGLPLLIESKALRERKLVLSATAVEVRLTDIYTESGLESSEHVQTWRTRLARTLGEMRVSSSTPLGATSNSTTGRHQKASATPRKSRHDSLAMGTGMLRPLAAGLANCMLRVAGFHPIVVNTSHFGTQTYILVPEQTHSNPESAIQHLEPVQTLTLIWEIGVLHGTITGIARSLLRLMNRLSVPLEVRYETGQSPVALTEWSRSWRADTSGGTRVQLVAPGEAWSPPLLTRLDRLQVRPWFPRAFPSPAIDPARREGEVNVMCSTGGNERDFGHGARESDQELSIEATPTWSERLPDLSSLRFLAAESYQRRRDVGLADATRMAQQRSSLLTVQGIRLRQQPFHIDLIPRLSSYARFSPMQHDWVDLILSPPVEVQNLLPQRILLRLWQAGHEEALWCSEPLEPGQAAAVHSIRSLNGLWLSVALLDPEYDASCRAASAETDHGDGGNRLTEHSTSHAATSSLKETGETCPEDLLEKTTEPWAPPLLIWSEKIPLATRWPCQGSFLCPRQYYITSLRYEGLLLKPPPDPQAITVPVAAQRLVLFATCWLQNCSDCALCIDAGLPLECAQNKRHRKHSPHPSWLSRASDSASETTTTANVLSLGHVARSRRRGPGPFRRPVWDASLSSIGEERFLFLPAWESDERPEPFVPLSVESFRVAVIDERLGSWSESIFVRDNEDLHVLHLPERALIISSRPTSERFGNSLILTIHNVARIVNRTPLPFEYVQTLRRMDLEILLEGRVSSSMGPLHHLASGASEALHWELAEMGRHGVIRIRPAQTVRTDTASLPYSRSEDEQAVQTTDRLLSRDTWTGEAGSRAPQLSSSGPGQRSSSAWLWSCGIPVGMTGHYALKLYCPETLRQYIARLTLQLSTEGVWSIIVEAEDPIHPPMRLQNLCTTYSIAYRQLNASRRFWMLRPGYTARYAWDNPFSKSRKLLLEVEQTRFELELNGLGECVAVLRLDAERRPLRVAISLDGPTKVITLYDDWEVFQLLRNGVVAEALLMARGATVATTPSGAPGHELERRSRRRSSTRWLRRHGFVRPTWPEENELASTQLRHLDCFFQLERIGISFLTAEPAELAYLTLHRVLGGYTTNYKGCAFELGIEGIELDNQRNTCVHPKVLRIRAQRLGSSSATPGPSTQPRNGKADSVSATKARQATRPKSTVDRASSSVADSRPSASGRATSPSIAGDEDSVSEASASVMPPESPKMDKRLSLGEEKDKRLPSGQESSPKGESSAAVQVQPALYPALYLSLELGAPYSGHVWNVRFAFVALQTIEVCLEEDFIREAWPFLRLLFSADAEELERSRKVTRPGASASQDPSGHEPGRQIYFEYLLFNPLSLRVSFFTSSMAPRAMTSSMPYQRSPGTLSIIPLSGLQEPSMALKHTSQSPHRGGTNRRLGASSQSDLSTEDSFMETSRSSERPVIQRSAERSFTRAGRELGRSVRDRYPTGDSFYSAHQASTGAYAGANLSTGVFSSSEQPSRFRGYHTFFRPLIAALGTVEDASLSSRALLLEHYLDSLNHWLEFIREFYLIQFRTSQMHLLASSNLLGNPARLLDTVAEGVTEFLDTPRQATSSYDFLLRLNRANLDLFSTSVRGLFRTVSAVSASLSRGLTAMSGDSQYIQKREERRRDAPSSIPGGLRKGLESFGYEMRMAVTGLVREPYRGAQSGSLIRGIRRALTQAVVRPANGFLDLIMHPSASLGARPQHLRMPAGTRVRPPRCFGPGLRLVPYRLEDALGNDLLWRLLNRKVNLLREDPFPNLEYYVGMFRVSAAAIYEAAVATTRVFSWERLPLGPRHGVILVSTEHIYGLVVPSERPGKFQCLWQVHWSEVVQVMERAPQPEVLELLHSATASYNRLLHRIKSGTEHRSGPSPIIEPAARLYGTNGSKTLSSTGGSTGTQRERPSTVQRLRLVCTSATQREELLQTLRQVFCTVARGRLFVNQTSMTMPWSNESASRDDTSVDMSRAASDANAKLDAWMMLAPGAAARGNRTSHDTLPSLDQLVPSLSAPPQCRAAASADNDPSIGRDTVTERDHREAGEAPRLRIHATAEPSVSCRYREESGSVAAETERRMTTASASVPSTTETRDRSHSRTSWSAFESGLSSVEPGGPLRPLAAVGALEGRIENRSDQTLVLLWQHLDSGYFQQEAPSMIYGRSWASFVVLRAQLPSRRRLDRRRRRRPRIQRPSPERPHRARNATILPGRSARRAEEDPDPGEMTGDEPSQRQPLRFRKLSGIILYALVDPSDQNSVYHENYWVTLEFVLSRRAVPRAHIHCPTSMRSMVQMRRTASTIHLLFVIDSMETESASGRQPRIALPRMPSTGPETALPLPPETFAVSVDGSENSNGVRSEKQPITKTETTDECGDRRERSEESISSESGADIEVSVIESYETVPTAMELSEAATLAAGGALVRTGQRGDSVAVESKAARPLRNISPFVGEHQPFRSHFRSRLWSMLHPRHARSMPEALLVPNGTEPKMDAHPATDRPGSATPRPQRLLADGPALGLRRYSRSPRSLPLLPIVERPTIEGFTGEQSAPLGRVTARRDTLCDEGVASVSDRDCELPARSTTWLVPGLSKDVLSVHETRPRESSSSSEANFFDVTENAYWPDPD
jgi:hypothetical protein